VSLPQIKNRTCLIPWFSFPPAGTTAPPVTLYPSLSGPSLVVVGTSVVALHQGHQPQAVLNAVIFPRHCTRRLSPPPLDCFMERQLSLVPTCELHRFFFTEPSLPPPLDLIPPFSPIPLQLVVLLTGRAGSLCAKSFPSPVRRRLRAEFSDSRKVESPPSE